MKLGTKVYRYEDFYGVLEYEVIAKKEYKDAIQFEVKCLSCQHGDDCYLLIGDTKRQKGKTPELQFIQMLSEQYEPHYLYHKKGTYHLTRDDAWIEKYNRELASLYEERGKLTNLIELNKARIAQAEVAKAEAKNRITP